MSKIRMAAPDGSRYVVAVFDGGDLLTEIYLDGPEVASDEDIAALLRKAGWRYLDAPDYPATRRLGGERGA